MRNLLITTLAIGSALSTMAVPLNYTIGTGSSVNGYNTPNSNNGLNIITTLNPGLPQSFVLDDTQVKVVNFFTIQTDEGSIQIDDETPQSITATLDFDVPNVSAVINGTTYGDAASITVPIVGTVYVGNGFGRVEWSAPALISVLDREFSVSLNDVTFGTGTTGFGDLSQGPKTIKATITQLSSALPPAAVTPDGGATAVMLGGASLCFGLIRRRMAA